MPKETNQLNQSLKTIILTGIGRLTPHRGMDREGLYTLLALFFGLHTLTHTHTLQSRLPLGHCTTGSSFLGRSQSVLHWYLS